MVREEVYARIKTSLPDKIAKDRVWKYCRERLERHQSPVRIEVTTDNLYGERYKKERVHG